MREAAPLVVVGGGPAGASCALALAQQRRPVIVLEREDAGAPKVCGEFLGPEAIAALEALEFPWALAETVEYRKLRLCAGERVAEAALPHRGRGVRRPFLDSWLLARAARAGAQVVLGAHVRGASWDPARKHFELRADGRTFTTQALFLGTGKHALGDVHGRQAHDGGGLVGLKLDVTALPAALARDYTDTLELFFFDRGYGGVARVGPDRLTLCLVVQRARARDWPRTAQGLLERLADEAPRLRALLQATPASDRPLAIAPLPYGHLEPAMDDGDHGDHAPPLFALGDQFAVLPSLSGTGIGLALSTGPLAAKAWTAGGAQGLRAYVGAARTAGLRVRRRALLLHRLVQRPPLAGVGVRLLAALPALGSFAAAFTRLGPLGPLLPAGAFAEES
jgi:flavin-dependent dehydrogenase